jgi:hypothetical protein
MRHKLCEKAITCPLLGFVTSILPEVDTVCIKWYVLSCVDVLFIYVVLSVYYYSVLQTWAKYSCTLVSVGNWILYKVILLPSVYVLRHVTCRQLHSYVQLQYAYSFFMFLLIYMLPECITNLAEVGHTTKKVEQARSAAYVAAIVSMVSMVLCDWAPQLPSHTLPAARLECPVPSHL